MQKHIRLFIIFSFLIPLNSLFAQQNKINLAVKTLLPAIIEKRHVIHQNPELGNREFKTSQLGCGPPS